MIFYNNGESVREHFFSSKKFVFIFRAESHVVYVSFDSEQI